MIDFSRHVVIDVESTGPCPEYYSLIEIGAVTLDGKEFHHRMRPVRGAYVDPGALRAIGRTEEEIAEWPDRVDAITSFIAWLHSIEGHLISWSDNPAFDWQFINHAVCYYGRNPLGHSMRRIGDLWAGCRGRPLDTSGWKKLRRTKHTHNALDDARGNAEALREILSRKWE